MNGGAIFKNSEIGCWNCIKKFNKEKQNKKYLGCKFGDLEVIEYLGVIPSSKNAKFSSSMMKCKCLKCGSLTEIPLNRLKQGGAKQCKKCNEKNLQAGNDISKDMCVEGTALFAIDGRRKTNKNSTTGIKGVSYAKNGKYRAYINFKRKQYHLGVYDTKEEAEQARLNAEKEIYGNFLEWYAKEHPDKWEKHRLK